MLNARRHRRVLLLGGTGEASALAKILATRADIGATLSLAGLTRTPADQPLPVRVGGFGGVAGLRQWLRENLIDRVVDATHPFASQMADHAASACAAEHIRRVKLVRSQWIPAVGDDWIEVADLRAAIHALGQEPRRVFLPVGRNSVAAFAAAPFHHYLIRSIEPFDGHVHLPYARAITARPPFTIESERDLLREHDIEVIVTKNSGGHATVAKLTAARDLRLPVILVAQPKPPPGPVVDDIAGAMVFIDSD